MVLVLLLLDDDDDVADEGKNLEVNIVVAVVAAVEVEKFLQRSIDLLLVDFSFDVNYSIMEDLKEIPKQRK